jgi:hypothetical protein
MSPVIVVIVDVLVHQALQVAFIENDHMIEQVAATRAYESISHAVLRRALKTRVGLRLAHSSKEVKEWYRNAEGRD